MLILWSPILSINYTLVYFPFAQCSFLWLTGDCSDVQSQSNFSAILHAIQYASDYKAEVNFFATAISGEKRVADGNGDTGIPVAPDFMVLAICLKYLFIQILSYFISLDLTRYTGSNSLLCSLSTSLHFKGLVKLQLGFTFLEPKLAASLSSHLVVISTFSAHIMAQKVRIKFISILNIY